MVGPHEANALRLHNAIDLLFRTSRLAVASHQYRKAAQAYDEGGGSDLKRAAAIASLDVSRAMERLFNTAEEIDELLLQAIKGLEADDRPEVVNGGFQVFGGADAEAALDRLAQLYRDSGHKL